MATVKRWTSDDLTNALKKHGLFEEAKQFQAERLKGLESNPNTAKGAKKRAWEDMHDVYRAKVMGIEGAGELIGAPAKVFTAEEIQAAVAARANGTAVALPAESDGESDRTVEAPKSAVRPDQIVGTASREEIVRWAGKNIRNERPDPATCPDPDAWMLWEAYFGNPSRFVEQVWAKVFLGKEAMEAQGRMSDDGRSITTLVSRCEQLRDAAESEFKQAVG